MRNGRFILSIVLACSLSGGAALAAPARSPAGGGSRVAAPSGGGIFDYVPQIDGPLSTSVAPDGRVWAAWAYRSSREFDVAIASKDPSGVWSPTTYFGRRDGVDQLEPALAVDASGTLYLAYATRLPSGISFAVRAAGSDSWSAPIAVTTDDGVSAPAIRIVGNRVVVAYRTPRGVAVVDLPTVAPTMSTRGIQDGPDSVDPLGNSGSSMNPGSGSGASSGLPGSGGGSGNGNGNGNGNGSGDDKH